jgi:hypothetical protein
VSAAGSSWRAAARFWIEPRRIEKWEQFLVTEPGQRHQFERIHVYELPLRKSRIIKRGPLPLSSRSTSTAANSLVNTITK